MTFTLSLRNQGLTQEQATAIIPVLNAQMVKRKNQKAFEADCLKALEKAGCPLHPGTRPTSQRQRPKPVK